jgi:hypothetical protein
LRKTALAGHGFSPLREVQRERWRIYQGQRQFWISGQGVPEPKPPVELFISDYTPEGLQDALYASGRGMALATDELVTLLDFKRYGGNKGGADAGRGFILGCYEDDDYPVRRAARNRTFYIEHSGCAMFGGIQRGRIADLKGNLEKDGFLQRCAVIIVPSPIDPAPSTSIGTGMDALYAAIKALCTLGPHAYRTTQDGSDCILETQVAGRRYASITDFGEGWPGFAFKLGGLHARYTLDLHLLEDPGQDIIPTERVERAHRLIHKYLLQHAANFHGNLLGGVHDMQRDIAGWLLARKNPPKPVNGYERVITYEITNNVASCKQVSTRKMGEVLDRFVTGGWLEPENHYPNNRVWWFDPALRVRFDQRMKAEQQRRADIHDQIQQLSAGGSK